PALAAPLHRRGAGRPAQPRRRAARGRLSLVRGRLPRDARGDRDPPARPVARARGRGARARAVRERAPALGRGAGPARAHPPRPLTRARRGRPHAGSLSLDALAVLEAVLVVAEPVELRLGPTPAVEAAPVVEADPPRPLHLDAERLHLPRPARDDGLDAPVDLRAPGARGAAPRLDERLRLLDRARGALAHVGQHRPRALERPASLAFRPHPTSPLRPRFARSRPAAPPRPAARRRPSVPSVEHRRASTARRRRAAASVSG